MLTRLGVLISSKYGLFRGIIYNDQNIDISHSGNFKTILFNTIP
jgi:hypothetical protein